MLLQRMDFSSQHPCQVAHNHYLSWVMENPTLSSGLCEQLPSYANKIRLKIKWKEQQINPIKVQGPTSLMFQGVQRCGAHWEILSMEKGSGITSHNPPQRNTACDKTTFGHIAPSYENPWCSPAFSETRDKDNCSIWARTSSITGCVHATKVWFGDPKLQRKHCWFWKKPTLSPFFIWKAIFSSSNSFFFSF